MTNILIVDDKEKICEFIKAFLDNEGYYADVAYDGKSAIDKINSKIQICKRIITKAEKGEKEAILIKNRVAENQQNNELENSKSKDRRIDRATF